MNNPIVNKTYSFVRSLYREYLPAGYWEFQLDLSMEMKNRLITLGLIRRLPDEEMEILALAAMLHNTGCIEGQYGGKEVSMTIADTFLREMNYQPELIGKVMQCISATESAHPLHNKLQKMIRQVQVGIMQMQNQYEMPEVGDLWP
ncbi:MAG: hypothetical protein DHS20C18_11320 [Saprospiraceae bacterium]|nr:MAG: hypothetical protein DHS20C18_11320 [Saprospiraceae bacterium]